VAIAKRLAESGRFIEPEAIRFVLLQWARETEIWWSRDLEAQLRQQIAMAAAIGAGRDIQAA